MIKGDYFGKLLKPVFSILLIGFFGLLGSSSVNAGYSDIIVHHNGQLISQGQGGLKFQVSGRGSLLSQYLGISRRVLAFAGGDEQIYFWWGNSGVPYMYYYYPGDNVSMQGFFNAYQICDEINSGSTNSTNCTTYHINTGTFYESLTPFFNSVKSTDYFGYSYGRYTIYTRVYYLRVCFSSAEYGQSVCFMSSDGLNSSLGLDWNLAFGDLPQSVIGNPPGYYEYGGDTEGSVVVNPDNIYTGDYTYTECTNGSIMNYAESVGLTPLLCQGGLDNWDLLTMTGIYDPIPGSGKWLDEIYGHTTTSGQLNAKVWFNYWNTAYINQYVSNQNIWYSQPAVLRSYFKFYNEYGGNNFDFETVYEYCLMRKFYTWDNSYATNKYQGQYFKKTCTFLDNGGWNNYGGNTGEDIQGLNWNGVGVLSGNKTYNDPGQFITDMFTKIKSYMPTQGSDIGGFLPTYIITFLLFLILFRFLAH